jgi:hypothetical protein
MISISCLDLEAAVDLREPDSWNCRPGSTPYPWTGIVLLISLPHSWVGPFRHGLAVICSGKSFGFSFVEGNTSDL